MDSVEAATFVRPGSPPITQITFLACRAQYPGGPNRCLSVSSLSARPSPVNRRVGIHDFTFEACSSFTRVTACKIARPPKGGLLSRGSGPASYPTKPLGSYHVSPTTTWMDPPSTGDLRRWGALLTTGWVDPFGSPDEQAHPVVNGTRRRLLCRRNAWTLVLGGIRLGSHQSGIRPTEAPQNTL